MIISVLSGKGGTGKTTVAVNLALSLAETERPILLDADVEEPNVALYLKPDVIVDEVLPVSVPVPEIDLAKCNYCGRCAEFCQFNALAVINGSVMTFPELCHGCGGCAIVCPNRAIREVPRRIGTVEKGSSGPLEFWQGRLNIGEPFAVPVTRLLKQGLSELEGETAVIIDAPPGTACTVVEAIRGSDYALLVTEPTPFGRHDLDLAIQLVRQMRIPHGVIINRAGSNNEIIVDLCNKRNVPILLVIPFSTRFAAMGAKGIPFSRVMPDWQKEFRRLYHAIKELCQCVN
ncbi:MAG TPA: P-loop NTPase [Syntrophomonadaceae bacterium]|nr:P-loop NTPase [Syntrophomonadaceae bacterium]